jgi:hypothetical protein
MSDYFLGSIVLRLLGLNGSQRVGIRNGALADIQFPQCPDKANGSACTFKLEPIVRGPAEMNLSSSGG